MLAATMDAIPPLRKTPSPSPSPPAHFMKLDCAQKEPDLGKLPVEMVVVDEGEKAGEEELARKGVGSEVEEQELEADEAGGPARDGDETLEFD